MFIVFGLLFLATAVLFLTLSSETSSQFLVFSTWGTATEVESFQKLIEHYNTTRRPKHRVKLSHGEQNQYTERLLVQAAARSLPDVIHLDRKDLPLFVRKGIIHDLTPILERDSVFSLEGFLPALLPGCQDHGRYYAIPHNFSTMVLYFNKDHFDAEGIPYPDSTWTWDTLLRAAGRLTKTDPHGKIVRYGCLMNIVLTTMIAQNGGRVLNEACDSAVIASPESEGAVQWVVDLSDRHRTSWSILAQNLQWDDMFAGGRLSMIANGRWAAAWYMRSMASGSVDVAPLPRGRYRKGAAVSHMMAISAQSSKQDEAWEFLKFLVSEEGQRMVNRDGANIPALRSVVYSDEFLRHHTTPTMNNRVFLDELPVSVPWPFELGPFVTHYTLQSQLDLALRRIHLGQATTHQSLMIMQENINAAIRAQRHVPAPRPFVGSVLFIVCGVTLALAPLVIRFIRRRRHPDAP
jgi:multiple sugar transport system substrate-binding protein